MMQILKHFYLHYLQRFMHETRVYLRGEDGRKVDFLICGAQKGGTTALDAYLRTHPEICMAEHKEVHYFDRENYFQYQKPDYRQYHKFFNPNQNHKVLGETTPVYMYWYTAPRRIWEYNPNMKLILILRNPIERAYSHWNMQRDRGYDTLSFHEAIHAEEKRRLKSLPWQNRRYSYLDRGYYSEQIGRLRSFFLKEQILILRNKQLRDEPEKSLTQIYQFIGVSRFENVEPVIHHTRHYISSMSGEDRDFLKHLYELEIKNLERITGWDCQDWFED